MVNIKLIAVGKIKEDYLKNEINEYLKRLSRYAKISVIEVDDEKIMNNSSLKEDVFELVFVICKNLSLNSRESNS